MNCYEHILIFHKHRDDKTKYSCPICGSLRVNSNFYSEMGLRSWECKNNYCFERSKCNRGKRFSLKTLFTQSNQGKDFEISNNLLKKWRRDIVKFQPVFKINSKGKNIKSLNTIFRRYTRVCNKCFSYPNDIVLDPFAGSFTVPIVANRLNRNGVGIELNKNMFKESIINNISNKLNNPIIDEIDLL